jgi:inner membrane protein
MRPYRKDWLHLDALCLTDPLLVIVHATSAVMIAVFGTEPISKWACTIAWGLTLMYIAWRIVHHELVLRRVRRRYRRWRAVHVLPGLWWFRWQYVVQTDKGYEMGIIDGRRWLPCKHLPLSQHHECVEATRKVDVVRTLQGFAKREYVSWSVEPDGSYLVTWTDLRFWREKDWPYRAEVRLDEQFNIMNERIGWYKKAWEAPYV